MMKYECVFKSLVVTVDSSSALVDKKYKLNCWKSDFLRKVGMRFGSLASPPFTKTAGGGLVKNRPWYKSIRLKQAQILL